MVEVVDAGVVECVVMGVGSGWCPVPWATCRVVATPPAWRHPTGFAGVSFATVSGLVVGWSLRCLRVAVVGVDGVFHKSVRYRGHGCWPWCGLSWWPLPLLMACASLVFEVVGVVAGR